MRSITKDMKKGQYKIIWHTKSMEADKRHVKGEGDSE